MILHMGVENIFRIGLPLGGFEAGFARSKLATGQ
jgi:hypothetical protein